MALRNPERWDAALLSALHPVRDLLEDDQVTEIEVNGPADIWIKGEGIRGHRRVQNNGWADLQDFITACTRISDVIQRRINQDRPVLNGRLPGGERVNIVIPPACEQGSMTIRKFPRDTMTVEKLLEFGSLNPAIVTMARSLVLARNSILVGGGTGAGKTSTLNALSRLVPLHERVVTVEDARELQIQNPNWVALETVEPYREGVVPVGIGDLVRNCLRMTPDRIVVGEVRGDEAFFLLRALSSGHGGGFGTIHCNDAHAALRQLQLLAQMAQVGGLTSQGVAVMVGEAIDMVFYQALDEEDGRRRITEVVEVLKPGAVVASNGCSEYQFRRLVRWNPCAHDWSFPQRPSAALLRSIQLLGLEWPEESLRAPKHGLKEQEGEVEDELGQGRGVSCGGGSWGTRFLVCR
jgi:pilus assembly protein CpaF